MERAFLHDTFLTLDFPPETWGTRVLNFIAGVYGGGPRHAPPHCQLEPFLGGDSRFSKERYNTPSERNTIEYPRGFPGESSKSENCRLTIGWAFLQ